MEEIARLLSSPAFYDENTHQLNFAAFNLRRFTNGEVVFLQGTVNDLQEFLADYFPQFHLVKDRSLGRPASIKDSIMQPFMNVMKTHPEQVTFLRDDFEKFVKDHVKLRVLSGPFKDYEGYNVRIDRDRQLVFDFGGRAVAIRGVHKEDFEVVEE
jgi:transcription antitermination factor NusG